MSAEELHQLPTVADPRGVTDDADTRPQQLTIASISRDGQRVLLVDANGNEFTVAVDDSLRAALPAAPSRRTEMTPMNSSADQPPSKSEITLRPRDIQARIRAGESAESVAEAAGTTVEKIMPFAAPVLAEREHVAERAQRSSVRRRAGEAAGQAARTLGDAVAAQLDRFQLGPDTVEWDAWRRHDGRWSLVALYSTPARSGTAELTFDAPGNFVSLDNDDARWLVGDLPDAPAAPAPTPLADELAQVRERRLAPVEEALPIQEPLEAFLEPTAPVETPVETPAGRAPEPEPAAETPAEAPSTEPVEEPAAEEPPARRPVSKKRGRASVPSWDEIMFGGGSSDKG